MVTETPRLLMICPTRGRPGNAARLYEAWREVTGPEAGILFAVDDDDPTLPDYRQLGIPLYVGPRVRLGATLNYLAAMSEPTGIFATGFLGDDHLPRTKDWALRFLDELDRMGIGMVYGNDLIQGPNLPTAIAMTSNIISTLGYMVPGDLQHLYVDNAWLELGRAIGRITYLPDVVIEHMHPIAGKAAEDDLYRQNNAESQYEADRHRFEDWMRFQFATDIESLRHLIAWTEAHRG